MVLLKKKSEDFNLISSRIVASFALKHYPIILVIRFDKCNDSDFASKVVENVRSDFLTQSSRSAQSFVAVLCETLALCVKTPTQPFYKIALVLFLRFLINNRKGPSTGG